MNEKLISIAGAVIGSALVAVSLGTLAKENKPEPPADPKPDKPAPKPKAKPKKADTPPPDPEPEE